MNEKVKNKNLSGIEQHQNEEHGLIVEKIEKAIKKVKRSGKPISKAEFARIAEVGIATIYKHKELNERITQTLELLKTTGEGSSKKPVKTSNNAKLEATKEANKNLRNKLAESEEVNAKLLAQNAKLATEILDLKATLAEYRKNQIVNIKKS